MRLSDLRQTEINRLRSQLELSDFPRLKMLLIVSITGCVGFLAAYWLLRLGVRAMALRYPAALGIAYLAFLFLLWLWLRTSADDYTDVSDVIDILPTPGQGELAGVADLAGGADDGGAVSEALGAAAQAEEFAIPLMVLVVLGAMLFSSLWMVYSAPVLFAELLVDGVLSASLYRKLRGLETQHWLTTAIRRTVWPFLITAVLMSLGGMSMQRFLPDAVTLGDVIHHSRQVHAKHD